MASIRDVAKRAGVSVATVSYVLNGTRNVSAEVREAVLKAVQEVHYVPNVVAKSLRERRTKTLGCIVPDISNPFFAALIKAFEWAARQEGYRVIVGNAEENEQVEEDLMYNLLARKVEGIALVPTKNSPSYLDLFRGRVPIVIVDRLTIGDMFDTVGAQNEEGAYQATTFLLEQGHRRILFLASDLSLLNIQERLAGYQRAHTQKELPLEPALVVECGRVTRAQTQEKVTRALKALKPTAVIAATNRLTLVALGAARHLGLTIPGDLSLVGFDDFEWSSLLDPPLTVVAQPVEAMGQEAFRVLLERITYGEVSPQPFNVRLPCTLVVRGSTLPRASSEGRREEVSQK